MTHCSRATSTRRSLQPDEILRALRRGVARVPLRRRCCAGGAQEQGRIQPLLDAVGSLLPAPCDLKPVEGTNPKRREGAARSEIRARRSRRCAFKTITT
jgi:translation elongation factor EF-G